MYVCMPTIYVYTYILYGFTAPSPILNANPIADAELNEAADNITSAISTMVSDLNAGNSEQFLKTKEHLKFPIRKAKIEKIEN